MKTILFGCSVLDFICCFLFFMNVIIYYTFCNFIYTFCSVVACHVSYKNISIFIIWFFLYLFVGGGRRGHDRMVVGFYHWYLSHLMSFMIEW
jgi:hypothetical protein